MIKKISKHVHGPTNCCHATASRCTSNFLASGFTITSCRCGSWWFMMDISKIKWMMNRATHVLWISMDWKTPSTHLRKARAKSSMHSFQLCSIQSSSSAHLAEKGDEKTHDWKKRNEHLQEIAGFSKNTQKKDTHTHTNDIYIYMYIIHYIYIYISISFVVFFQASIEACSETYCATLHLPCLFAWTAQRHQPHHGLAVGRPSWSRVQSSDSSVTQPPHWFRRVFSSNSFTFWSCSSLSNLGEVHQCTEGVKKNAFGPSISAAG